MSAMRYPGRGWILLVILGLIVVGGRGFAQVQLTPSSSVDHALMFTESDDVTGMVDRQQVRQSYTLLMQRLKIPEAELPHVVVIHASPQLAHAAGVRATHARRNAGGDNVYYELWLLGKPQPGDYVGGLCAVLNRHFNLQLSDEQQTQTSLFVLRILTSTVHARAGRAATPQR